MDQSKHSTWKLMWLVKVNLGQHFDLVNNFDLLNIKYTNELIFLNTLLNHLHWFWTLYNHGIHYIFLSSTHIPYFQHFHDVKPLETVRYEVPNSWTVHLFLNSFIALIQNSILLFIWLSFSFAYQMLDYSTWFTFSKSSRGVLWSPH